MPSDNKSIVRRMYEEVWNKRRLEVAVELIAPSHAVQLFDAADSGVGPEAYARNVTQFVRAFPDLRKKTKWWPFGIFRERTKGSFVELLPRARRFRSMESPSIIWPTERSWILTSAWTCGA